MRKKISALLLLGIGALASGCSEQISSYHTSRMNGLAHAAELSAADAKRSADDMAVSAEQLASQVENIRHSANQAESDSRKIRGGATVRTAPTKLKKPVRSSIIKSGTPAH